MGPSYPSCGAGDAGGEFRRRPGVTRKNFPMILPLMILFQSPFGSFCSPRSRGWAGRDGKCSESLEAKSWGVVNGGRYGGRRTARPARTSASSRRRLRPLRLFLRRNNFSVGPMQMNHRDTMNTEKTPHLPAGIGSLIRDFLESLPSLLLLCVHRVSVVQSPVPAA